jgi:hypothetical protein
MKAIYKKRLLTLAKFLRTVPKKRFNMGFWAAGKFCGKVNEPEHNQCGTAACAMGWACTIPEFRRAGLKLIDSRFDDGYSIPVYKEHAEFDAARKFFGLPEFGVVPRTDGTYVSSYLFGGDNVNSPIAAAKRIERYIKLEEAGKITEEEQHEMP